MVARKHSRKNEGNPSSSTEFHKLTCPKGTKRNLVLLAQTQSAQKKRHNFSPLRNQGQKVRPTKQARDSKSQAVTLILPSPKMTAAKTGLVVRVVMVFHLGVHEK